MAVTGEIPDAAIAHAGLIVVHPTLAQQPIVIVCVINRYNGRREAQTEKKKAEVDNPPASRRGGNLWHDGVYSR